jgi:hypothetical protein
MAAPNSTSSNSSAYALILAYILVVLSLWKIDTGLVGRPEFTAWGGNNAVATRFAPTPTADDSRSEVYRLLASTLEQFDAMPSAAIGADPQNEELRRLTAVALMVYVTGDGIRR